jgi:hypothetical protein
MKSASAMIDLVSKSRGELIAPQEVLAEIAVLSPQAVETVKNLMLDPKSPASVRLKAALEVLALAGVSKETKISISGEVSELDDSALTNQINQLLGRVPGVVIEATAKDVTPEEEVTH